MKWIVFLLTVSSWSYAQLDYQELKKMVDEGAGEQTIVAAVEQEGLAFDLDLKWLRKMKRDNMPDWFIDYLIDLDNDRPTVFVAASEPPSGPGYWHGPSFWSFYRYGYYGYGWFNPFYDGYYPYNEFCFSFWDFWNPYRYCYPWSYYNGPRYAQGSVVTPNGYRYHGGASAHPRGDSKQVTRSSGSRRHATTRSGNSRSSSRSAVSRSGSSSRSSGSVRSSSGGSVSRSGGYSAGRSGGNSARRHQ